MTTRVCVGCAAVDADVADATTRASVPGPWSTSAPVLVNLSYN